MALPTYTITGTVTSNGNTVAGPVVKIHQMTNTTVEGEDYYVVTVCTENSLGDPCTNDQLEALGFIGGTKKYDVSLPTSNTGDQNLTQTIENDFDTAWTNSGWSKN